MIEQLFGSKTRVKLLRLFYSNPNRSFYVREITRKVDEQINSVRRELSNLLAIGIIKSDTTNNKLYYEVNQSYEFYEPFRVVFGGAKLVGAVDEALADPSVAPDAGKPRKVVQAAGDAALLQLGNVELAVYTGQFTRDETAGIDFLIIGDINHTQLGKHVTELEEKEGKEIRYTIMTVDDFRYRETINDRFISAIKAAKKQILVDKQGLLS